jgi:hypothetical protein
MQATPASIATVVPHSGASEGKPVQGTHVCPLHAGKNSAGHAQANPVEIGESCASYRFSSDTLMAAPTLHHAQSKLQIVPVAIAKQSEF